MSLASLYLEPVDEDRDDGEAVVWRHAAAAAVGDHLVFRRRPGSTSATGQRARRPLVAGSDLDLSGRDVGGGRSPGPRQPGVRDVRSRRPAVRVRRLAERLRLHDQRIGERSRRVRACGPVRVPPGAPREPDGGSALDDGSTQAYRSDAQRVPDAHRSDDLHRRGPAPAIVHTFGRRDRGLSLREPHRFPRSGVPGVDTGQREGWRHPSAGRGVGRTTLRSDRDLAVVRRPGRSRGDEASRSRTPGSSRT